MTPLTRLGLALGAAVLAACSQPLVSDAAPAATDAELAAAAPAYHDFTLPAVDGGEHTLSDYVDDGKIVVLEWFNPGCPVTRRYHTPERRMAATFEALAGDDLVWLAINSGAPGQQGSGLEPNRQAAADWQVPYPLLLDESGETGRAYGAATTPHMFVITPAGEIAYDGAIDDSGSGGDGALNYVAAAVAAVRRGVPVEYAKTKPFGCSVKYAGP